MQTEGWGLSVGVRAMDLAIEKARAVGSGWVTVANSRHFGAAGVYATRALEHDMIGISMTNTGPIVLPAGGAEPRLGSNPIAVAAPTADGTPFIFDAATSVVSAGKFDTYNRQGKLAPVGWGLTDDLQPIRDPARGPGGRRILPLGSDLEHSSYKGYGLAMVVDILSGVLSGMGPGLALAGSGQGGRLSVRSFLWRATHRRLHGCRIVQAGNVRLYDRVKGDAAAAGRGGCACAG